MPVMEINRLSPCLTFGRVSQAVQQILLPRMTL